MSRFKAHADVNDTEKINGLLDAGLFITNTMLVLEKPINTGIDKTVLNESMDKYPIEKYDSKDLKEYLKANGKGFGAPDPIEVIEEELSYNNAVIYVWREKGKIVSSITTWDVDEETIATENIFTIPKYRNRHIASTMLQYVLDKASERGMKKARLTVYGDDTAALSMYYNFGYAVTKTLHEFTN